MSRTYKSHLSCSEIPLFLVSASREFPPLSTRRLADIAPSPQRRRDATAAAPAGPAENRSSPWDRTGPSASRGRAAPPVDSVRSGLRPRSRRGHRPGPTQRGTCDAGPGKASNGAPPQRGLADRTRRQHGLPRATSGSVSPAGRGVSLIAGRCRCGPGPGPARAHRGPHRKQLPPFLRALPRPGHVTVARPLYSVPAGGLSPGAAAAPPAGSV